MAVLCVQCRIVIIMNGSWQYSVFMAVLCVQCRIVIIMNGSWQYSVFSVES